MFAPQTTAAAPDVDGAEAIAIEGAPCVDAEGFAQRVAAHGDAQTELATLAQWRLEVRNDVDGTAWLASLGHRDGLGPRRELRGESCDEVVDAAALSLALALAQRPDEAPTDATAEPSPTVAAPSSTEVAATTVTAAPVPADARRGPTASPQRRHARHELTLAAGVVTGMPRITTDLAVGHAWVARRIALETGVDVAMPRRLADPIAPSSGALVLRPALRFAACPGGGPRHVRFAGCGGADLGVMMGRGRGVERPRLAAQLHPTAFIGLALAWRVTPVVELRAQVEGYAAITRPRMHLGERPSFVRAPLAGVRAVMGVGFTLAPRSGASR